MEREKLFSARSITKKYPGTVALDRVNLDIYPGEVVGLVGENGAGKSTFLKIVMGIEQPTAGDMEMYGEAYRPRTPIEANRHGIGMVFQEQSLIQNLTIGQNVFFGQEEKYTKFGVLNKKKMNEDAREVIDAMGLADIRVDKKVNSLDFATRQMIEIAKVFNVAKREDGKACIILLDEPTSVLSESEVQNLFKNINRITAKGNSVVFISHRLDEVLKISNRIYIFKDGRNVCEIDEQDANENILYEKMVGKTATGEYYKVDQQIIPEKTELLRTQDLGKRGYFRDINFTLHKGEVIGICGVIGSGKEELCDVICGDDVATDGELYVRGQEVSFKQPYQALKCGVLSIPKERREEGLISDKAIYENISMSNYKRVSKNGLISLAEERKQAGKYLKELEIKAPSIGQQVGFLSGGNAQKVVFARVLASNAEILVLNHPTRGVDIGAKGELYSLIRDITAQGKGVILLGDTLDECIGLSNRLLVMKDGEITQEFDAPPDHKPEQIDIVKYMM